MEFNVEQVVQGTQKQLLELWFEVYSVKGSRKSQAARKSHAQARRYLVDVGVPESALAKFLIPEEDWVKMVLSDAFKI